MLEQLPAPLTRAWATLSLAYVVVIIGFLWSQPIELPPAIAQLERPSATLTGYLVSQTSDAVYLAAGQQTCKAKAPMRFHRRQLGPLLVIPRDRLVLLRVGRSDSTNVRPSEHGDRPQPPGFVEALCGAAPMPSP